MPTLLGGYSVLFLFLSYGSSLLGGYGARTRGVFQHLTLNGKNPNQTNLSRPLSMLSTIVRQCRLSRCGPLCHAVLVTMPAQPMLPGGNAVSNRNNADMVSMPACRCCQEAMLASRQCRCAPGVDDAVRRLCWHRANAVAPQAWMMRSGDYAGIAPMPLRPWRG